MSRLGKRRPALQVLALESREVPAVAISLVGGNLTVTGDQVANTLVVRATADNQFQVLNTAGGPQANLGTYNVPGNLNIRMGNSADNVSLDIAAFTYTGSVAISTGNGDDTIAIAGGGTGVISGNLTTQAGNGIDRVDLGRISIGGNSTFDLGFGGDNATFTGDRLGLTALGTPVTFGGNVSIVNADNIFSDVPCSIQGNLIVSANDGFNNSWRFGYNVAGNAVFTSSAGDDLFRVNENSTIASNLTVNLGAGDNTFQLGANVAVSGDANVGGTVTLLAGNGNDNFQIGSVTGTGGGSAIGGSLNINAGDGNNSYNLAGDLILAGSLAVTGGNGNDDLATNPVQAIIAGSANFLLGNGNNSLTMGAASTLSGNLYFRTGGGIDTLTLLAAQTYNLNASFGAGNDLFVMNNAGLLLNGFLDFGTGDDVMTQTAGTFGNINIINL